MNNKGLTGKDWVELFLIWLFAAVTIAFIFLYWRGQLAVESIVTESEIADTRKINYGEILLGSELLAYADGNGVHKGVFDYEKIKDIDPKKLFDTYRYQKDDLLKQTYSNYWHYVRIEVLESEKGEPKVIRELVKGPDASPKIVQQLTLQLKARAKDFIIAVRYSDNDIRIGRLHVSIGQF